MFLGGVVVRLLILGATRELHYESTTRRTIRRWPSISYQAQGSATRAASSRHVPLCIRRRWRLAPQGAEHPPQVIRAAQIVHSAVMCGLVYLLGRTAFDETTGIPGGSAFPLLWVGLDVRWPERLRRPVSRRGVLRLGFPVTEANLRNNLSTSGERPLKMAATFPSRATASALLSLRSSSAPPATSSLGLVLPHPNGRSADVPADFSAHSRSHDRVTSGAVERAQ